MYLFNEMDGVAENTFSAQYSFFISFESTENYTITMTCENKFKDESINRLDKIIKSISLKLVVSNLLLTKYIQDNLLNNLLSWW